MAKFDVEGAAVNIPVHPSDRFLLGMRWSSKYYLDLAFLSVSDLNYTSLIL